MVRQPDDNFVTSTSVSAGLDRASQSERRWNIRNAHPGTTMGRTLARQPSASIPASNARVWGAVSELQGIARFKIHEGKLEEFKRLSAQCMEIVRSKDTGTLQYDIDFNDDQSECIVRERYRDSEALIEHTPRTLATYRRQSLRRSPWFTANSSVSRAQS